MHRVNLDRRLVLKGGLAAGSLFLPMPYAWVWAQSEGAVKLMKLPKIALVLGNGKYKEAPLKNPANDAKAISDALKATGFDVTLKVDAGKEEMASAVQAYVQALAAKKCVGLFYYAGHGIQLAWRNYMLPVDADIDTIGDIQKQAVEVNALLDGLNKAGNPMNVIILDACRDNPFGNLKGMDHKGLSQMDAPQGTLLAYATGPGNVASDGEGANGLYTENLLREIKVNEAKVEDVFKRVRLGVRVKSKGAQIPWESTSLEEDFWFIPPKELKKLSDEEKERQYKEELARWEKVQSAAEPGPLEDYLKRYPNGDFSELAQLRLDQVLATQGEKKIMVASQEGNPFTRGSIEANTAYKVGDSYTYKIIDNYTKLETMETRTITRITEREIVYDSGLVTDLLGNPLKTPDGRVLAPSQQFPLEYAVGKRWTTRFEVSTPKTGYGYARAEGRIVARERVTVPAGTFDAFRCEIEGYTNFPRVTIRTVRKVWMAPDQVRRPVAIEQTAKLDAGYALRADRQELVSFKQG
jgi:hypothetical protein